MVSIRRRSGLLPLFPLLPLLPLLLALHLLRLPRSHRSSGVAELGRPKGQEVEHENRRADNNCRDYRLTAKAYIYRPCHARWGGDGTPRQQRMACDHFTPENISTCFTCPIVHAYHDENKTGLTGNCFGKMQGIIQSGRVFTARAP